MKFLALAVSFASLSAFMPQAAPPPAKVSKPTFKTAVAPFLKTYCATCHAGKGAPDGIDYSKVKTLADGKAKIKWLRKGVKELNAHKMPPAGSKMPSTAERNAFKAWVARGRD